MTEANIVSSMIDEKCFVEDHDSSYNTFSLLSSQTSNVTYVIIHVSCSHSFIHSFVHSFVRSFIHSFIHSFPFFFTFFIFFNELYLLSTLSLSLNFILISLFSVVTVMRRNDQSSSTELS